MENYWKDTDIFVFVLCKKWKMFELQVKKLKNTETHLKIQSMHSIHKRKKKEITR